MKYDKKVRLDYIECCRLKDSSIGKIAKAKKIPRQTLTRWLKNFRKYGEKGLENKKSGVKEISIDLEVEKLILQLYNKKKRTVYRMRKDLKIKDINISEWQIRKIYKKHKLN